MSIQEKIDEVNAGAYAVRPRLMLVPRAGVHPAVRSRAKRALDLAVAIPALVLLAPLMLAIAVAIALDSKGPVFFRQTRTGQGGRLFDIYKFRTMHSCENGERIMQARANDPRVTRIGRILRRTSLDELPQLINVIAGEMSLIGPRPHALAHDRLYAALIDNYVLRQAVKPGISGWAQINGHRGETPTVDSMRARVEHDLWYARHQSFALDVKIIVRTAYTVLSRADAW